MEQKIELLAPAGSLEILKAAVDSGADAVYIGAEIFNARINAGNLSLDDIREGCLYAHLRSSLVYLTLNTLIREDEMDEALSLACDAYNMGVDGFIIQDLGLASRLHEEYPSIPLHASTQMNIYSANDFKALKELGFDRVVLPRELSLDEIKKRVRLASREGLDTEVFAHGAVCVCYSGLCLFSSMNKSGSRSGNRGLCAQPCRQEYSLTADGTEIKTGHLISPKDRGVVKLFDELIKAGVRSLKIEGRMRDVGYVSSAVRAYRKLIDAYYENSITDKLLKEIDNELLVNFNRGGSFTSQRLTGKKPDDLLSGEYVGKFGLKLGTVSSCDARKGNIVVSLSKKELPTPSKGDYISIRRKNKEVCSFPIGKIHEAPGSITVKGLHPDMISKLEKNEIVYLMSHDFAQKRAPKRKTHIDLSVDLSGSGIIRLNAKVCDGIYKGVFAETEIDTDPSFEGNPLSNERIEAQLRKTGETPFEVDEVWFTSSDLVACPVSLINDLRRSLIDQLISEIEYEASHNVSRIYDMFGEDDVASGDAKQGEITTLYIFPSFRKVRSDLWRDADMYGFYIYDILVKSYREQIIEFIRSSGSKAVIVMPDLIHDDLMKSATIALHELKDELGELFEAVIDSDFMAEATFYEDLGVKHYLSGGANIHNRGSVSMALNRADAAFISYELAPDEVSELLSGVDPKGTIILHSGGNIPWMQSDFCPIGNNKEKCRDCYSHEEYILKQGEGEKDCIVLSRPYDCSASIWGESKFVYSQDDADTIADYGFDVIQCYTEV